MKILKNYWIQKMEKNVFFNYDYKKIENFTSGLAESLTNYLSNLFPTLTIFGYEG